MPTQTHFRITRALPFLVSLLLVAGCVPWQSIEPDTAPASARPGQAQSPSVSPAATQSESEAPKAIVPSPRPTRKLVVIQAKVDSRRRIVAGTSSISLLGSTVEALARELAPHGVLTRGTQVDAVYEAHDSVGSRAADRRLVALRVGTGPTSRIAVLVGDDGLSPTHAYALDGRPITADFLRYPIAHLRVTSGFTTSRKHPISKKHKPHLAIDFAAPYGTPIVAVADGEVIYAKWAGGYGRHVRIQHDGDYVSAYAHLQRYATGIKAGARVTKGQVIGYVGNSGTATGPHLHFALLRAGIPIDPLGASMPTPPRLAGDALVALHGSVTHVEQILAAADREDATATRLASAKR